MSDDRPIQVDFYPNFIVHLHKLIRLGKGDNYLPSSSAALVRITPQLADKFIELNDAVTVIVRYKSGD